MRRGAIGQVRRGRLAFVAEVLSLAHVLNQTVGRTFQHACDAQLGDARCSVDVWFALGRLIWTSGANVGRVAEVTSHDVVVGARRLKLLEAPVRPIEEGDDFVVRAGCDKRLETCRRRPSSAPPRATAAPSGSSGR
jgi:hypothetical protein